MKFTADNFIAGVVAVAVACIVLSAIAIPVITEATPTTDGPLKSIMEVLPVFIAIGILMACIGIFISRKG